MRRSQIIRSVSDLAGRTIQQFEPRLDPTDALLCAPDYFDVIDVKNPHMKEQIGRVDRKKARAQWEDLSKTIERAGSRVHLLPPTAQLEDMVFTANPVLPGLNAKGEKVALLSNMTHPSRKKEVPAYRKWFEQHSYKIAELSNPEWRFEGQGDALWHPGRKLIWGGYGFRTVEQVYEEIAQVFDAPVVVVQLLKEEFYHLDTCFAPLSENEALFYPAAFTSAGLDLLKTLFKDLIPVPEIEAKVGFACNCSVFGKKVLLQKGNGFTNQELVKRGYEPVELDTSEFIKSGGSVFCMKMMIYP